MTVDLTRYGAGESLEGFPSFVKAYPAALPHVLHESFAVDWWAPERFGHGATDYAIGQMHFASAIAVCRECGSRNTLAFIVGSMTEYGCGPMERGFIDALARKATAGRIPPPMSTDTIAAADAEITGSVEIDPVRHGEKLAYECLDIARRAQYPDLVAFDLIDLLNRNFGYGGIGYLWTVCGAALAGTAH